MAGTARDARQPFDKDLGSWHGQPGHDRKNNRGYDQFNEREAVCDLYRVRSRLRPMVIGARPGLCVEQIGEAFQLRFRGSVCCMYSYVITQLHKQNTPNGTEPWNPTLDKERQG
jgi:hypothetical protein